jgi:hypothetical protein
MRKVFGVGWVGACALIVLSGCSSDSMGGGDRGPGSSGGNTNSNSGGGGSDTGGGSGGGFGNQPGTGTGGTQVVLRDASVGDSGLMPPDEEGNCGGIEVEPMVEMTTIPGNLLFVFDKSGSMDQQWSGNTGNSKWDDAVAAVPAALTALQDQVTASTVFFPHGGDCNVPALGAQPHIGFMAGPAFLNAWSSFMMNNGPNGGTPLLGGLRIADQQLQASLPTLMGTTNVVIVTDGQPNCAMGGGGNDDEPVGNLTPFPANWLTQGVKTYVVGLPGSGGAVALLDALAVAGGTMQHIPANDPMTLQTELAKIIGSSVTTNFDSCSLDLDSPPPNLDDVHVVVVENGIKQRVDRDLGAGGGWTIKADGSQIILQGLFCDLAKMGQYEKISVAFGCVELPPLPPPKPPE